MKKLTVGILNIQNKNISTGVLLIVSGSIAIINMGLSFITDIDGIFWLIWNTKKKSMIHCYAEDYVLGDNNLYVIEDNKIEKKLEGIEYYINIPEDDVYYKSIYES